MRPALGREFKQARGPANLQNMGRPQMQADPVLDCRSSGPDIVMGYQTASRARLQRLLPTSSYGQTVPANSDCRAIQPDAWEKPMDERGQPDLRVIVVTGGNPVRDGAVPGTSSERSKGIRGRQVQPATSRELLRGDQAGAVGRDSSCYDMRGIGVRKPKAATLRGSRLPGLRLRAS